MKKLHSYSGAIIALFVIAHLFNHIVSVCGVQQHIDVMNIVRKVYRNTFVEVILLLSIMLQMFTGVKLYFAKRKTAIGFFPKLQIWSGLYLVFFFFIHLTAIFVGRWVLKVDTNFFFGVAGLNTFPFLLFFVPYYSLAIVSFFAHLAAIHNAKCNIKVLGLHPKAQANIIFVIGLLITIVILYGATNGFKGVVIPVEYKL